MRGLLKFFAYLSFIGDCISALGTVYPQWENSWKNLQARKEALKSDEEKEEEARIKWEQENKWRTDMNNNGQGFQRNEENISEAKIVDITEERRVV